MSLFHCSLCICNCVFDWRWLRNSQNPVLWCIFPWVDKTYEAVEIQQRRTTKLRRKNVLGILNMCILARWIWIQATWSFKSKLDHRCLVSVLAHRWALKSWKGHPVLIWINPEGTGILNAKSKEPSFPLTRGAAKPLGRSMGKNKLLAHGTKQLGALDRLVFWALVF